MYFPIGWPKQLKLNDTVHHLAANNDKSFVAILGLKTIKIWLCKVKNLLQNNVNFLKFFSPNDYEFVF